jgi:hypothetical protein
MKNWSLNLFCLAVVVLLSGCRTTIDNLTPPQLPTNSSHIYTMTMAVHIPSRDVIPQSLRPFIVIDGRRQSMKRSELGHHIFVYDYRMSRQCEKVRYYYEVEYDIASGDKVVTKTERSQLFEFQVLGRCILSLDVYRGIPGTKVVILGRGFQNDDRVIFGDVLAETHVHSDRMIECIVPMVDADKNYRLSLQGSSGNVALGDFFVDLAPIYASKNELYLRGEERQTLTLSVDHPVPPNGLLFDITTDIPEDIVMPEVLIPGGARSVEAFISGNGYEASGHLFVEARGYQPLVIPVSISGQAKEPPSQISVPHQVSSDEDFPIEWNRYGEEDQDIIVIE